MCAPAPKSLNLNVLQQEEVCNDMLLFHPLWLYTILCNEITEPFDVTLSHAFSLALLYAGKAARLTELALYLYCEESLVSGGLVFGWRDHDEFVNTMRVRGCHAE